MEKEKLIICTYPPSYKQSQPREVEQYLLGIIGTLTTRLRKYEDVEVLENARFSLPSKKGLTTVSDKQNTIYFWRPNEAFGFLSQWYRCAFSVDGRDYCCAEQYMMAEKARFFGDTEIMKKILKSDDPKEMKALGRKIKNFDQRLWDSIKYGIVVRGNFYKFLFNDELYQKLINTKDSNLAEASPYDKIWGIGISAEEALNGKDWQGTNLLGKALMEVRDGFSILRERFKND